ncbi:hypothetical protein FRC05_001227 [Tulasnella sp. 425]|nr:hypothetical protein FRC05_001227 [Tulasnella sp. 425]
MMLPQVYHSSETSYYVSGADASVIKLPPAESSVDTVIAASSADAAAAASQNTLASSGNKWVSVSNFDKHVGGRLTLVVSRSDIARLYLALSGLPPPAPPPRQTPISSFATSSVSDEVASLKARLAESEAVAEDLMREKAKALSTSRQLVTGLENLRNQKVQWAKEKDELMEKLRALDEDKATLVVSPPSEGAWSAGLGEQQHVKQLKSHSASPKPFVDQNEGTQRPEGKGAMKVRLGPLDEAPRIPEIRVTPPETAPPNPPTSGSLRRHFLNGLASQRTHSSSWDLAPPAGLRVHPKLTLLDEAWST